MLAGLDGAAVAVQLRLPGPHSSDCQTWIDSLRAHAEISSSVLMKMTPEGVSNGLISLSSTAPGQTVNLVTRQLFSLHINDALAEQKRHRACSVSLNVLPLVEFLVGLQRAFTDGRLIISYEQGSCHLRVLFESTSSAGTTTRLCELPVRDASFVTAITGISVEQVTWRMEMSADILSEYLSRLGVSFSAMAGDLALTIGPGERLEMRRMRSNSLSKGSYSLVVVDLDDLSLFESTLTTDPSQMTSVFKFVVPVQALMVVSRLAQIKGTMVCLEMRAEHLPIIVQCSVGVVMSDGLMAGSRTLFETVCAVMPIVERVDSVDGRDVEIVSSQETDIEDDHLMLDSMRSSQVCS